MLTLPVETDRLADMSLCNACRFNTKENHKTRNSTKWRSSEKDYSQDENAAEDRQRVRSPEVSGKSGAAMTKMKYVLQHIEALVVLTLPRCCLSVRGTVQQQMQRSVVWDAEEPT